MIKRYNIPNIIKFVEFGLNWSSFYKLLHKLIERLKKNITAYKIDKSIILIIYSIIYTFTL